MKKQIILLLTCILAMCIMGCGTKTTGTSADPENLTPQNSEQEIVEGEQSAFLAKVISADEQVLLVEPLYGEWELRSSDRIEVGVQDILTAEECASIAEGDMVQVIYDGYLLETYPARTQNAYDVIKKELGEVFSISYSSWYIESQKNIYDIAGEYIQKDLIVEGVAAVDYIPDAETLASIWDKIAELDLLSIDREMTSEVLTDSDKAFGMEPCIQYEIIIQINGVKHTITGDGTAWYYKDKDEQADSFSTFVSFMEQLMKNTVEYQLLPEAVGGYD